MKDFYILLEEGSNRAITAKPGETRAWKGLYVIDYAEYESLKTEVEKLKAEYAQDYSVTAKLLSVKNPHTLAQVEEYQKLKLLAESYRGILAKLLSTPEAYGTEGNETWDDAREALEKK